MKLSLGPLLLALASVAACAVPAESGEETGAAESGWGILQNEALTPSGPQFLINKPRDGKYRVCLPRYMADAYPGIASEVHAAVNVWAAYLGRSITVEVVTKDLPRSGAEQSVDDLAKAYHTTCGEGFDTVMGLANLTGKTVGLTGASYRYIAEANGSRRITSFSRYLFLRDHELVPSPDEEGVAERWTSLEALEGRPRTGSDLLGSMLARATTHYASANTYLMLPVLMHEYGHVWGLCDQYEGSTNCDPRFSSSHRFEAGTMGARGGVQRLFLSDDDVEGIRALAQRPGFAHGWAAPSAEAPPPAPTKPVLLARIENVRRSGDKLIVKYGVVTSGPARYAFALQDRRQLSFIPLQSSFDSAEPFEIPTGRMTITLNAPSTTRYRVRLLVTPEQGDPVTVIAEEPERQP